MLLAKEAHPFEHLAGALGGGVETRAELGVLALQFAHLLRRELAARRNAGRILELPDPGLGLERAAPEAGQLVREVTDELVQLVEGLLFRTFAV